MHKLQKHIAEKKGKKEEKPMLTPKQRRRKIDKWMNKSLYHSCPGRGEKFHGLGEKKKNIMSNATRRKLGLEQDSELDDYQNGNN